MYLITFSYILALPAYNMNKWTIFVYFLTVFIVKMADSGRNEETGRLSDNGRSFIAICTFFQYNI